VAIRLLHPARVHRMHAGKRQSELPAGIAQLFEDMKSKLSRDVELTPPRAGLSAKPCASRSYRSTLRSP
jgi:hypothetical protein